MMSSMTGSVFKRVFLLLICATGALADEGQIALQEVDASIAKKDYALSVEKLTVAIEQQHRNLAHFYQRRAECYSHMGEHEKAEQDYRKVLGYSVNGRIEFAIGKSLYEQRKFHEAYDMFKKANALVSEDDTGHVKYLYECYLYLSMYGKGEFDAAVKGLETLRGKYPDENMDAIFEGIRRSQSLMNEK